MSKETSYLDLRKLQNTLNDLADTLATLRLPGPPGDPGEPGLDADPAFIRELVTEAASPELLKQLVDAAVAEFPKPADGKDADPAVIQEMVRKAVARIPKPEAGKDADPAIIRALVDQAFAALRVPEDGKPGPGVPSGGNSGQILAKLSDEDYDTHWIKLPGGAGSFSMWNASGAGGGTGNTNSTFGMGAPSGTADDGTLYFDTFNGYTGYVFHSGAWHQFSQGSGTSGSGSGTAMQAAYWFFMLGN